jgi:hypothetical protein
MISNEWQYRVTHELRQLLAKELENLQQTAHEADAVEADPSDLVDRLRRASLEGHIADLGRQIREYDIFMIGSAVIQKHDDGRLEVVHADDIIGIATQVLAEADTHGLRVDDEGLLWIAGDPRYRYRPVRFASGPVPQVLICERVR